MEKIKAKGKEKRRKEGKKEVREGGAEGID